MIYWFICGNCGDSVCQFSLVELLRDYGDHMKAVHSKTNWHNPRAGSCLLNDN